MLLKYTALDLFNSSITDVDSGVHLFAVHTESFYTAERVYHPVSGTQDAWYGRQVAEILWAGRVPLSIHILGEALDGVTTLFNGCESVSITSNRSSELRVPTRFGAVWVATRRSLQLRCSASGELRSALHLDSVQVGPRFHSAPMPGMGSHFLEIRDLHSAQIVEMIVSCLVMDVLRRNVFYVSPRDFDQYLGPCRQSDRTSRSLVARLAGPSRLWSMVA
ncbi:hypothetical protein BC826DRAFT_987878 [Russula brevipes]|nr:hypothetical protein BC826DRAFT_987878 [Russula brevipes]